MTCGYSQGAGVANVVKGRLAAQYPGPTAPDIDFVLGGDPNLPNGGLMSRFPGLYEGRGNKSASDPVDHFDNLSDRDSTLA